MNQVRVLCPDSNSTHPGCRCLTLFKFESGLFASFIIESSVINEQLNVDSRAIAWTADYKSLGYLKIKTKDGK